MADSKLNSDLVLRRAFDPATDKLRVDAEVTASIGTVEVIMDAAGGDNVAISDGTDTLAINPDGSINSNVEISAADGDNIAISDGTNSVGIHHLVDTLDGTDHALVVSSVIHGRSSQGGGTFVDVKVNPSGSLETNATINRTSSITTFGGDETVRIDDSDLNITYFGYAATGANPASAVWKIFRLDESSGTIKQYADGNSNYDNVWDNRNSLTYT